MATAKQGNIIGVTSPIERERRRNRLVRKLTRYAFDYIILLAIISLSFGLKHLIKPFERPFSVNDLSISYPFMDKETISTAMLIVVSTIMPLVLIILVGSVSVPGTWEAKLREVHTGWLGLLTSISLAMLVSSGTKILFGKPRPDFLSRCKPNIQTLDSSSDVNTLFNSSVCTQTDRSIIADGFGSFPSRHAALSFAGLTFLSFFLAMHLSVFDSDLRNERRIQVTRPCRPMSTTNSTLGVWRMLGFIIPLLGAGFVSLTRVAEFKHAPVEILCGAILGATTAVFSYRFYFPTWAYPSIEIKEEKEKRSPISPTTPRIAPGFKYTVEAVPDDVIDIRPMSSRMSWVPRLNENPHPHADLEAGTPCTLVQEDVSPYCDSSPKPLLP